jgi:hypothetical protein
LFQAEAISNVGEKHSYLSLNDLKKRKNPDVANVVAELILVLNYVNYEPISKPDQLTRQDIENLIMSYKQQLNLYYEQRNQKNQIRMIIESM